MRPVHIYTNTARGQCAWIRFAREKVRIVVIKVWTAIARRSNAEPLANGVTTTAGPNFSFAEAVSDQAYGSSARKSEKCVPR